MFWGEESVEEVCPKLLSRFTGTDSICARGWPGGILLDIYILAYECVCERGKEVDTGGMKEIRSWKV